MGSIHFKADLILLITAYSLTLAEPVRVYPYLLEPKDNPDYDRYAVTHPSPDVFNQTPQFATLRVLPTEQSRVVNYTQVLGKFCLNPNTTLGAIVWPRDPNFMFSDNYKDVIDYIKVKGLYITSVHGFSPVSAGFRPPGDALGYLENSLGSKWFGMANGEQDGHYFGAFIGEELPLNNEPVDQYIAFRDYFDKTETTLGPKMTTLLSSTYPHYQLKTGLYTVAGAETSQHGPNAQLRYAFIRGAGKQYGVLWFGNVSVYNRFGHKVYFKKTNKQGKSEKPPKRTKTKEGKSNPKQPLIDYVFPNNASLPEYLINSVGDPFGPTCGTSLNLMKRLMYSQMMYNSGYTSFEGGWFYDNNKGEELSPIGLIQHNAYLWTQKMPMSSLGVQLTTVALYLEYFNGWASPRQNRGVIYRTWTNVPYTGGDYLTDGLLRMMYPGYQDASYFHDETGVSSPTPYGDIMDVILSDAPVWILKQYDTVIISSQLTGGAEVERKLLEYVESGGHLVITADNLAKMPHDYFNVSVSQVCTKHAAGASVYLHDRDSPITETNNMTVCGLNFTYTTNSRVLAWLSDSTPLAILFDVNNGNGGSLVTLATPYGLSSAPTTKPTDEIDKSLTTPFPLLDHARVILHNVLTEASIIQSTGNLSIVTNYLDTNPTHQLLVLVTNPELREQPLDLITKDGKVGSIQEIVLDNSEKGHVGYLPDGYENTDTGKSTTTTIAGGDTRLFAVKANLPITKLDKIQPKSRPRKISLHLRHIELSIRREILTRPTFFEHYDSVVIDYSYLITKDVEFLNTERVWLRTQGVKVYVDASPSINLFPGLRLTNDAPDWYNDTITAITVLLSKMNALGCQNLVISLHVFPGDQTRDATSRQFNVTLHYINDRAKLLNITVHLLDTPKNQYELMPMSRWLDDYGLSSVKFVLCLSRLIEYGYNYKHDEIITSRTSMLYINAPGWDLFGNKYTDNQLIHKTNKTARTVVAKMLHHFCTLVRCPYKTSSMKKAYRNEDPWKIKQQSKPDKDREMFTRTHQKHEYGKTTARFKNRNEEEVIPIVMDGVFESHDEEYEDIRLIEQLLTDHGN